MCAISQHPNQHDPEETTSLHTTYYDCDEYFQAPGQRERKPTINRKMIRGLTQILRFFLEIRRLEHSIPYLPDPVVMGVADGLTEAMVPQEG